jgi:glycosyltransferase involved in cell wall biosynthesis
LHKKRLGVFNAYALRRHARKIIYDFDDAVMYSDKCPDTPSPKRLRDFQRTVGLADLVIAGNVYLAEHARKFNSNVEILPTGLDTGEYDVKITRPNDGKVRLVWIGSKVTLPYLKEITPALEEIGSRLKNVVLRVISDEFIDLQNMKVEKCAWSQQTQACDLVECDIGLAPLPDNPFTRGKCGFKILQYTAAGLPSVVSPVGVNARLVRDGVNGYHAVTIKDWIEKISALVANEPLRTRMGSEAKQMICSFDLNVTGHQLVKLVKPAVTVA